ncbi:acyl carrier protein [Mucilaginibacter sp. 21P]|nr:acyl carrier protein [Mucilaginibacter sp. 21P]
MEQYPVAGINLHIKLLIDMNAQKNQVLENLKKVIAGVYEVQSSAVDVYETFLEMGLDSISIIQVKQLVKNQYKLDVPVDRLFNDIDNLDKLSDYIEEHLLDAPLQVQQVTRESQLSVGSPVQAKPKAIKISPAQKTLTANAQLDIQAIINAQLQVMQKQIEILATLSQ